MRAYEFITESKVLKTLNGSTIKRSPRFKVGKDIGGAVYLHKYYESVLPDNYQHFKQIMQENHPDFEYNIIKYTPTQVSFLHSPDFDSANEPLITAYVTVKENGDTKIGKSKTIYHHKWLFVGDDYPGFDVEQAFKRSKEWLQIPNIDFNRIGSSREFWLNFLRQNAEHLPDDFIFEASHYRGQPLETGGTSTNFNAPAPALQGLIKSKQIKSGDVVLDYGAGKYGRNANHLRDLGFKTYGYDPFNGYSEDGWNEVSTSLPNDKFDVGFTSFVLNVVPIQIEEQILSDIESRCDKVFHFVRNFDVFNSVKNGLARRDKTIWNFFVSYYAKDNDIDPESIDITDDLIFDFCEYGVQTSKGFQRICHLENYGYTLLKGSKTSPYKVYKK